MVAHGRQCRELFVRPVLKKDQFPVHNLFAGQHSIGMEYAFFKALRDSGLNTDLNWAQLNSKQRRQVEETLARELESGVPVIVDPHGRVFSVDQHHDMFAMIALIGRDSRLHVPIKILRDFSAEKISFVEFQRIVRRNGWIYEKSLDDVLLNPLRIHQLTNSVERSVVGMAFAEISQRLNIPLKGKYFSPFIQFLLADFVRDQGFVTFGKEFRTEDVKRVVDLILSDVSVRQFLMTRLTKERPAELEKFLKD